MTLAAGGHGPHAWPGSVSYQDTTQNTNPTIAIHTGNEDLKCISGINNAAISEQNRLEQNYSDFYSTASMMIKKEDQNNTRY